MGPIGLKKVYRPHVPEPKNFKYAPSKPCEAWSCFMTFSAEVPSINPHRELLQTRGVTRNVNAFLVKPNLPSFVLRRTLIFFRDLKNFSVVDIVQVLWLPTRRYHACEKI